MFRFRGILGEGLTKNSNNRKRYMIHLRGKTRELLGLRVRLARGGFSNFS